jgi:transcriptional repressor NrdR
MKCPYCHHKELKVTDSRDAPEMNAIRRRRECLVCLRRFTTFETIELTVQVQKRDGRYEDFQQQKLIKGLEAACRHTTISYEQVIAIASQITDDVMQRQVSEISTTELGDIVMKQLQALDPIAYIRFACVYRRFKNIEELMEALQSIKPKDDKKRQEKLEKV